MISLFRKRKSADPPRKSLVLNIEPTYRCNLKCGTCPRKSIEGEGFDMQPEIFARICAELDYARAVDLTGWGEPLLHPDLDGMIRKIKHHRIPVSMTSNGTLLSEGMTMRLIRSGLDRIAVSVDGMRPETCESIRRGLSFRALSSNLKNAASMIREASSSLELSLAFTIQKQNLSDLELIVPWMREHGIKILHLKHLNVLSNEFDWNSSLISLACSSGKESGLLRAAEAGIREVMKEASKAGMTVNFYSQLPLEPTLQPQLCIAAPLDSVYISFDGKVSPCCHLGHLVSRYFAGRLRPHCDLILGDLSRNRLVDIWNSPPYAEFRNRFAGGKYPASCESCYLLYGK